MEIINILTPEAFAKMEKSVAEECAGMDVNKTGVSVVLWRLKELLRGYRWALDHGYQTHKTPVEVYEERETSP